MASIMRVRAASTGWVGAAGLNTLYFVAQASGVDVDGSLSDANLCVDRVQTAFTDAIELWPTQWLVQVSPDVDLLNPVNGELVGSWSTDVPGALAGDTGDSFGPTPAMLLLRLNTNTFSDGSRLQGRTFLGPLVSGADSAGSPSPTLLGLGVEFGDALLDAGISAENPRLVVWRRPRIAKPEATPPVTARDGSYGKVTSTEVPDKYAILRSRRD